MLKFRNMKKLSLVGMSAITLLSAGVGSSAMMNASQQTAKAADETMDWDFAFWDSINDETPTYRLITLNYGNGIPLGGSKRVAIPKVSGYTRDAKTVRITHLKDDTYWTDDIGAFNYEKIQSHKSSTSTKKSSSTSKKTTPKVYKSAVYATKQLSSHKFKKTQFKYSKAGYIYTSSSLKYWNHKGANYKHTKWVADKSVTVKKSNGKKAVYYHISNKNNGIKGWIWKGNLQSTPAK